MIMPRIIRNAIRCKKCGDVIESKTVHDFKFCSCGSCAVDGGHDYLAEIGGARISLIIIRNVTTNCPGLSSS